MRTAADKHAILNANLTTEYNDVDPNSERGKEGKLKLKVACGQAVPNNLPKHADNMVEHHGGIVWDWAGVGRFRGTEIDWLKGVTDDTLQLIDRAFPRPHLVSNDTINGSDLGSNNVSPQQPLVLIEEGKVPEGRPDRRTESPRRAPQYSLASYGTGTAGQLQGIFRQIWADPGIFRQKPAPFGIGPPPPSLPALFLSPSPFPPPSTSSFLSR
ncbi:uncharacterized protein BO88DRAFT_474160 [Aspergillus vadensis CBS 113365]|uniref:Uncharacterized protein n=1 Tax=Aspergillus vadensis (strain CBS 113365 / IMI 142717 / IBT 24658) TaxID=1448311 RepID=A0A319AXF7_ASPVC|nr:hypothetical protein BO88DRAFT_474160 [Aspergillus vadensis CBS 113365]PYH64435.1 hypothetical protein BO88DRAFT_474160 [Aspergillus vadensis CBS 113365]